MGVVFERGRGWVMIWQPVGISAFLNLYFLEFRPFDPSIGQLISRATCRNPQRMIAC